VTLPLWIVIPLVLLAVVGAAALALLVVEAW
jgi:hypothetical protein